MLQIFIFCFGVVLFFPTDKNTVAIIAQKPINSLAPKDVFSIAAERTVAEAGSRQPIKVALTGPIYFTPERKREKDNAVPINIITATIIKA